MMSIEKKETVRIVSFSTQNPLRQQELLEQVRTAFASQSFELSFPADEAAAAHALPGAEILLTWKLTPDMWRMANRLRWIHLAGAGADRIMNPELRESDIVLTNSRGIHGRYIAEWVLAAMLYRSQRLDEHEAWRRDRDWEGHKRVITRTRFSLRDQHVLILGFGAIGSEIGRTLNALDIPCAAIATKSRPHECIPVFDHSRLTEQLARADVVIIAMPLTSKTEGFFDREKFALMKPDSAIINIARGKIADETALIEALRSGHLSYAALDVFAQEPLPVDSPYFDLPNVFLAPHVSGNYPDYTKDVSALFVSNLRKYLSSEPLDFLVDKSRGY